MKRLLTMLLALALAMPLLQASAEGYPADINLAEAQPLADLAVAAAVTSRGEQDRINSENSLSDQFVYQFFLLGQSYDSSLGITPSMLSDPSQQAEYLQKSFQAPFGQLAGILSFGEKLPYIGFLVMAAKETGNGGWNLIGDIYQADNRIDLLSEGEYTQLTWLDQRAMVILHQDAASPSGWCVDELAIGIEANDEGAANDFFLNAMNEFVSSEQGWSIEYPSVFSEETLHEADGGISGMLADGTASFSAGRRSNSARQTLEELLTQQKQENPQANTNISMETGMGTMTYTTADGRLLQRFFIVTEEWIYQAELLCSGDRAAEFSAYGVYMKNSFSVDELGVG